MHDPTSEETQEYYRNSIVWLKKVVPDDEIHALTQQMIMCAEYFMDKWMEWVDIEDECKKNPSINSMVSAVCRLKLLTNLESNS